MEFGNVEGKLEGINFTLPQDPEETTKTLKASNDSDELQVYVGGTKWADKTWIGRLYPRGLNPSEFLKVYSENFNTVEFGPTFYVIHNAEYLHKWREQVAESTDFKFLPRFPQAITHIRKLLNVESQTHEFYESLTGLYKHVGPLLLQLMDNFSPESFPKLKAYLESLPTNFKVALEVRNKYWFAEESNRVELYNLLHRLQIAWVITDSPGRRDCVHMTLPTTDAIIRFVGATPSQITSGGDKPHEIDYARLDAWVDRLRTWKDQGLKSIWFFVHQHNERYTPIMCDYLIQQLNLKLGVNAKRPTLLS